MPKKKTIKPATAGANKPVQVRFSPADLERIEYIKREYPHLRTLADVIRFKLHS